MLTAHEYYAAHGPMTSPGTHAALFEQLPTELDALVRVVHGLMIHVFWADQYGLQVPEQRSNELQLRSVAAKVERILELDPRPLTETRPVEQRLIGNCRDFSVLLAAMLQHQGVPARARCGFGRYFLPNHYEDHWVCEYWNAAQQRWLLVDAQLDQLQRAKLSIAFDPQDVPRDQFIVGGHAWQLCRSGQANPDDFGIFEMHGFWFVRGNFVRDIAALNKIELLPWDSWGIMETLDADLLVADLTMLDQLAALTCGDVPEFAQVRALYEHDQRLRVPSAIHSYVAAGMQTVELALA